MLLEAAMRPASLEDLQRHYKDGSCLVLEGEASKFEGLVTLADIERRLNDGCNASVFPQIIKEGSRSVPMSANGAWAPASTLKSQLLENIQAGYSFMMANSSQISRPLNELCREIEAFFIEDQVHADVHLYVSTSKQGNSYDAHRDYPQHKLLLQAIGDANWQLFEGKEDMPKDMVAVPEAQMDDYLTLVSEFTLGQGDLLYMPPGVFHRVVSVGGPRVSISIPFYSMPSAERMDRCHIPFERIFEQGTIS